MKAVVVEALKVGVPTLSGFIYGESICRIIIDQFEILKKKNGSNGLVGYLTHGSDECTHVVEQCWLADERLMTSLHFADSPAGTLVARGYHADQVYLAPCGTGGFLHGSTELDPVQYQFRCFNFTWRDPGR